MTTCGETRFEERCDACAEAVQSLKVGHGKRAKWFKVCGCPETVEAYEAARSVGRAVITKASQMKPPPTTRRKGDAAEHAACREWSSYGFEARQTAGSGSVGSRNGERAFDTDIRVKCGDFTATIESKAHSTLPIVGLVKMLDRSNILRLENNDGMVYYFMPKSTLGELAGYASEAIGRGK